MKCIALTSIILLAFSARAVSQDEKVAFHVSSVSQADATDWCTTGKCSAVRFTVEGYTQDKDAVVEYVLECVEVLVNEPTPHFTVRCPRVHSHSDYLVRLVDDYVLFGDPPTDKEKSPTVGYQIKSEKEVRKK